MIHAFATGAEEAVATGAPNTGTGGNLMASLTSLLPFLLMIAILYFLIIRPQRKKDKENKEMLANLKVGDEICTIGGVVGRVSKIKDEKIYVETGAKNEGVTMLMERWAVRNVIKPISAD